jgi:hypothetical protein
MNISYQVRNERYIERLKQVFRFSELNILDTITLTVNPPVIELEPFALAIELLKAGASIPNRRTTFNELERLADNLQQLGIYVDELMNYIPRIEE